MSGDKRTFHINPNLETGEEPDEDPGPEVEFPVTPLAVPMSLPLVNPVLPLDLPIPEIPEYPVYVNTRPDMEIDYVNTRPDLEELLEFPEPEGLEISSETEDG